MAPISFFIALAFLFTAVTAPSFSVEAANLSYYPPNSPLPSAKAPHSPRPPKAPKSPPPPKGHKSPPNPVPVPSGPGTVTCGDTWYGSCYRKQATCPAMCPQTCHMDCSTCKAVCPCDKPGGVCQDPRFVGGDGVTFYFHGRSDTDFCLVSDETLHVNAHFIGKSRAAGGRDLTWVQALALLFWDAKSGSQHVLHVAADRNVTESKLAAAEQMTVSLDGRAVKVPEFEGARVAAEHVGVRVSRVASSARNALRLEVADTVTVTANAVCIGRQESRIHNYDIDVDSDCYAHLDVAFKFHSLSEDVSGVLGRTYSANYVTPASFLESSAMHVVGGESLYQTSDLFTADCAVSRYSITSGGVIRAVSSSSSVFTASPMAVTCSSGVSGRGIVCRR